MLRHRERTGSHRLPQRPVIKMNNLTMVPTQAEPIGPHQRRRRPVPKMNSLTMVLTPADGSRPKHQSRSSNNRTPLNEVRSPNERHSSKTKLNPLPEVPSFDVNLTIARRLGLDLSVFLQTARNLLPRHLSSQPQPRPPRGRPSWLTTRRSSPPSPGPVDLSARACRLSKRSADLGFTRCSIYLTHMYS